MDFAERMLILEKELKPYKKMMGEAVDIVLNEDVSKYPIIVVHQDEIELGIPLYDRNEKGGKWSINASTLEEFVGKQVIHTEKVEEFLSTFKDPELFLCLFVLNDMGSQFIFTTRIYNYN
jgi:hypothetical protein